jgi:hypothetical protein
MSASGLSLTVRERYQRRLDFAPVDRAPFTEIVPGPSNLERWAEEGFPPGTDFTEYFGLDLVYAIAWVEHPDPPFPSRVVEETEETIVEDLGTGMRVERSKTGPFRRIVRPPIQTVGDWAEYRLRLNPGTDRIPLSADFLTHMRHTQQSGACAMRSWCSGFFGGLRELLGPEPQLLEFYGQPELLRAMCNQRLAFQIPMIETATQKVEIDLFTIGEGIAHRNGAMISPAQFRDFLAPYYPRLVQVLNGCGVRQLYLDTDGDFTELIPEYLAVGFSGLHPIETQAGMAVRDMRWAYPRVGLMGGADKRQVYAPPGAIERDLHERIAPVVATGGYFPAVDHSVPREASVEQYRHCLQVLKTIL